MSLFIGALAFEGSPQSIEQAKLGTLAGSLLSAIAGWIILRLASPRPFNAEDREEAAEIFGGDQETES
jgi:Na+:H+ antiporter, NhaA family